MGTTIGDLFGMGSAPTPAAPVQRDPTQLDPVESARRERELRRIAGLRDTSSLIVPPSPAGPSTTGTGLYVPPPIQ